MYVPRALRKSGCDTVIEKKSCPSTIFKDNSRTQVKLSQTALKSNVPNSTEQDPQHNEVKMCKDKSGTEVKFSQTSVKNDVPNSVKKNQEHIDVKANENFNSPVDEICNIEESSEFAPCLNMCVEIMTCSDTSYTKICTVTELASESVPQLKTSVDTMTNSYTNSIEDCPVTELDSESVPRPKTCVEAIENLDTDSAENCVTTEHSSVILTKKEAAEDANKCDVGIGKEIAQYSESFLPKNCNDQRSSDIPKMPINNIKSAELNKEILQDVNKDSSNSEDTQMDVQTSLSSENSPEIDSWEAMFNDEGDCLDPQFIKEVCNF